MAGGALPDLSPHDLGDIEEAFNSDAARQLFADPVQFDLGDLLSEYKVRAHVTEWTEYGLVEILPKSWRYCAHAPILSRP